MSHERLLVNTQRICNAVDVVEVGDNLGGVVDSCIIKAALSQGSNIRLMHRVRLPGQFFCIGAQRLVCRI